jgi:NADPH:quinone reductase-like Zn-dependent oxidoreductase
LVKQLGADEVIDYTSVNVVDHLSKNYPLKFDLIMDNVGSFDLYNASPKILKDTGEFVAISTEAPSKDRGYLSVICNLLAALFLPQWLGGVPRRYAMRITKVPAKDDFKEITGLIERKEVKPFVDSVWSYDDEGIRGGYQRVINGHPAGKVVVKIHV